MLPDSWILKSYYITKLMKEFYRGLRGKISAFGAYLEKAMEPPVIEVGSEDEAMIARMGLLRDNFYDGSIALPPPVIIKIKD